MSKPAPVAPAPRPLTVATIGALMMVNLIADKKFIGQLVGLAPETIYDAGEQYRMALVSVCKPGAQAYRRAQHVWLRLDYLEAYDDKQK